MATTFPGAVDYIAGLGISDAGNNPHQALHMKLGDAVMAMQTAMFGMRLDLAASVVVPGATSYSIRDHANTRDNLLITDAGGVGIGGVASSNNALTITSLSGTTTLGNILAEKRALSIVMTTNWSDLSNGQFYDLIDIQHKSAGDAIYIAHLGGLKPAGDPTSGADAALNVLIPYYRDDIGTGRAGSVLNNYTGMKGLVIGAQPTTDITAVSVAYWGSSQGLSIQNQFPNTGANPQGNGNMFWMQQYGTGHMIKIDHHESPATSATFKAVTYDNSSGSRQFMNLAIDGEANQRFQITYSGALGFGLDGTAAPDATINHGTSAKQITIQSELKVQQASGSSANRTFSLYTTGDGAIAFQITGVGKLQWGDRTAAFDAALYRNGVNILKTDGALQMVGLLSVYNNITTQGNGVPSIIRDNYVTTQTNATVTLVTYTLPAADGSYEVSASINCTSAGTAAMTVTVSYTDANNVAQTQTLQLTKNGTTAWLTNGSIVATGDYASAVMRLRCKASTTLSIQTAGTVTAVVYTGGASIKQVA